MTTNILSAAAKSLSVKRVMFTSSGSVYVPFEAFLQGSTGREVIAATFGHPIQAYAAAKSFALEAAEDFIKAQKPHFDLVSIFPSIVIGADALQTTSAGLASTDNNKELPNLLLGGSPSPVFGSTVSVQDTATLHVRAPDSKIPGGRYLASSEGARGTYWEETFDFVKKFWPEESKTIFKEKTEPFVIHANVDTTKTQETFGFKFQSYKEQVKSVVG